MRPVNLLCVFPALMLATAASAQEGPPENEGVSRVVKPLEPKPWVAPKHMIDINPVALLNGELSLEYENALGNHVSLLVGPDVLLYRGVASPLPPDVLARGASLKFGVHIFPWGNALNGFWFGPELVGLFASVSGPEGKGSAVGFEADGAIGYSFIIADHLGISLGVGAGYRMISVTTQSDTGVTDGMLLKGLALTGRLAIGYAF